MKLFKSFLSIGALLACIYYSIGDQKADPFTSSPSTTPAIAVKIKDDPIKPIRFQGSLYGDKVILQWMINDNEKVNQFEIEKSDDGKNFKTAALVFGTDRLNTESYVFFEKGSRKEISYRIKVINNNGIVSYSDIIEMNEENSNESATAYSKKIN